MSRKISYSLMGLVIGIIILSVLVSNIPEKIHIKLDKTMEDLRDEKIDYYVDLSEVLTLGGYRVDAANMDSRIVNGAVVYGRENPMGYVEVKESEEELGKVHASLTSNDKKSSGFSSYYVYPYSGGEAYYEENNSLTRLSEYIDRYNNEYLNVINNNVKGYDKRTAEMKELYIGDVFHDFIQNAYLPVSQEYMQISSSFGVRKDPFNNLQVQNNNFDKVPFHTGLDISAAGIEGSPVFNMMDGVVKKVSTSNEGYGNLIIVTSGEVDVYYAHLESIKDGLKEGSYVFSGETIGKVGNTGRSTGPHLHLEIVKEDIALNPELFIPEKLIINAPVVEKDKKNKPQENNGDSGIKSFIFDEM